MHCQHADWQLLACWGRHHLCTGRYGLCQALSFQLQWSSESRLCPCGSQARHNGCQNEALNNAADGNAQLAGPSCSCSTARQGPSCCTLLHHAGPPGPRPSSTTTSGSLSSPSGTRALPAAPCACCPCHSGAVPDASSWPPGADSSGAPANAPAESSVGTCCSLRRDRASSQEMPRSTSTLNSRVGAPVLASLRITCAHAAPTALSPLPPTTASSAHLL